jgi:epoxyqueuosine reductase
VTGRERSAHVKAAGRSLGFERVAVGSAAPPDHGAALAAWLDAGHAGTMAYLERTREKRLDPARVLPGARSVVACALGYHQGQAGGPAHVARYAWGDDYHAVVEPRLAALLGELRRVAPGTEGRAYVDTGPVLERDLAARAGLGWIGKSTMLLHPSLGSYFVIGVVLTTAELEPDEPVPDRCGTCTRCLEACPGGAFVAPYVLDARRCVSYLTIEHRGAIAPELRPALGGLVFGCDVCQAVCPWNHRAAASAGPPFRPRALPTPVELCTLDETAFRDRLAGSPLRRARRAGLARSAAVVLGNLGGPGADEALTRALHDPDPLVRGHAAWGLGRLATPEAREALGAALAGEPDPGARREIEAALGAAGEVTPRSGDALVVVDVQRDFCPGGALAVPGGDAVVPACNRHRARFRTAGAPVVFTRDWHPPVTRHFAAHGGAWPPHCVQGSPGAAFHPDLEVGPDAIVVSKGMDPGTDAYSGFEATDATGRPLAEVLAARGVRRVFVAGLATDYCVRATALDARRLGFEVVLLADAVRAVDLVPGDGARALAEMRAAGVEVRETPGHAAG